jgi:formylglycine-generating enzyme required for sulfatase activity
MNGTQYTVPPFRLDKYEVTVARFRAFVNAAPAWQAAGNPVEGAGAHPSVPDSGWRTDWMDQFQQSVCGSRANGLIPAWVNDQSWFPVGPDGEPDYNVPGSDTLAVNLVPFHIAFAFCIWDGGRLPAAAEYQLAVHGGDGTAAYPWGDTPTAASVFVIPTATVPDPNPRPNGGSLWLWEGIPVGSLPAAAGRFGHQDLVTGMQEYLRDAALGGGASSTGGLIELGGDEYACGNDFGSTWFGRTCVSSSWEAGVVLVSPAGPVESVHGMGDGMIGFRCARNLTSGQSYILE